MPNFVAIFCEDIREEVGGSHTIVGVMPDNINVQSPANQTGGALFFPKMAFYLRINLEVDHEPNGTISARVSIPGLADLALGELGEDVIQQAFSDSRRSRLPFVGVIFKSVAQGVSLNQSGQAIVYASIEGREHICGAMNISVTTAPQ
jgi:hypothetical protein